MTSSVIVVRKPDETSRKAREHTISSITKILGNRAEELAGVVVAGMTVEQCIAISRLLALAESSSRKGNTQAASKARRIGGGEYETAIKLYYIEHRDNWKSRRAAAIEMTAKINSWLLYAGEETLILNDDEGVLNRQVLKWLGQADKQ